ncbi:ATP-binding cassette domain-containing protein [Salinibacterium soli]|uniref:ATP-binding cassette domain-containing protein n=1 Tax=Antiquaquibacter soli TaxID=3064523 RepID=A0ABT9BK33_9MICO|nr:ATP-binding cassette domain-containing protein [Protaetiibacter sp. WY-16]MDO7881387.1 ATP-binding cassette domain-containing protein [Protaetiibacter sp. WY-16]
MENAAPGSGKKPQKKSPSRPSSPTRKPAPARKPAPRTPAARKPAVAPAEVVEETIEEALAPVEDAVDVVEEGEVTADDAVAQDDAAEQSTEPEPEPETAAEPGPEPEAAAEQSLEPEPEPEPEAAPAEVTPETASERPAFSLPKLTVPKITLPTAALARASRAVADAVKSVAAPDKTDAVVETVPEPEPDTLPEPEPERNTAPEPAAIARAKKPRRPARKKTAAPAVLTVTGLTKRFDDTVAVDGIDLTVPAGAFYGIVGPNGAGKTTTLSMVTGLLRPDAGTVTVHGADVWADPAAAKRNMGVLPDRLRLFDKLTGSQLLYYSGVLRGLSSAVTKQRTADLAEVFGIQDALGRLVSDYSSGMTKKVALAAALIHSPRLLVLDEPFESVDPVSASTVTEVLKNYVAQGGTVLLSSHSMDLVERICDNVAIVVGGSILADGTIAEVRGSGTLEEKFVELAGSRTTVEGLEWLHSFSD